MSFANPALTFAIALAAGIVAQSLAQHLRVPGIVLLLLGGVALGPDVLDVVRPGMLGHGLDILVGLSVAVILFEGGLNLNIGRIRREATTIRRLITIGAGVTAIGATLAARAFMGWDWRVSTLFGTLVIVTGPTVITPLLRRIRVNPNLQTILEAEGVLIDPVGAIIAVVALEVVLASSAASAAVGLLGIPYRLLVGTAIGAAGGLGIAMLLRHDRIVPEGLENVAALSLLLALFETSDAIVPESGIMCAVIAGLVVGNLHTRVSRELREFKEQLTVMLVGLLFILLAADVRIAEVVGLGWPGIATVLALIFVVRPVGVAISTHGSSLDRRERAFIAWLGPRGIVAAAVASLFAQRLLDEGIAAGADLRALVFLVIAVTVVLQGLSGGFIASLLGVRRPREQGYAIVGANAVGRTLARALADGGEEVVLIDTNADEARAAEADGLRVIFGNAYEEATLLRAHVDSRRGFIATTPNEGVNLLLARRATEGFRVPRTWVALQRDKPGVQPDQVREARSRLLFAHPVDIDQWRHRLRQDTAIVQQWRVQGEGETPIADFTRNTNGFPAGAILTLAVQRGGRTTPADHETRVRRDDVVTLLCWREIADAAREHLAAGGWAELRPGTGVAAMPATT